MTSEPTVESRVEQPYVAIPITVPMREWGKATALVGEVIGWLGDRGIDLTGPPFFRYWTIGDMDREFDLEVGAPTPNAVAGDGRVIAGSIPGGPYAIVEHHGHPDRLVHSLAALEAWAADRGIAWANSGKGENEGWGGRFEFYPTDPAEQPDPEKWTIEVAYLIDDAERGDGLPPGLPAPARRALAEAGYTRLEQFAGVREADLRRLHGMGPKALGLLRRALADNGRSFADG